MKLVKCVGKKMSVRSITPRRNTNGLEGYLKEMDL